MAHPPTHVQPLEPRTLGPDPHRGPGQGNAVVDLPQLHFDVDQHQSCTCPPGHKGESCHEHHLTQNSPLNFNLTLSTDKVSQQWVQSSGLGRESNEIHDNHFAKPCIPTYVVVDTNADWSQTSSANVVCAHLLMSVAVN